MLNTPIPKELYNGKPWMSRNNQSDERMMATRVVGGLEADCHET
jgi:hypothetical protein